MISPLVETAAVPSAPKCTYTRSPSRIGVGEAQLFFGLISRRSDGILKTSTLSASCPVAMSNAIRRSEMPRWSTAVVSHTRPPPTTGDDQPRPGTGVFHATLRVSLHSSGSPRSLEWPSPSGPRNCGQSCASTVEAASINHKTTKTRVMNATSYDKSGLEVRDWRLVVGRQQDLRRVDASGSQKLIT